MKPQGAHPDKALNAARVRTLSKPGRHADGNGLYLLVEASGARRWVLRTMVHGKRRDIGLGGARLVSLAEARDLANQYRRIARDGGDPLALRRESRRRVPDFETAAKAVHAEHLPSWRNPKHAAQWISTLTEYAFPSIGTRPVDQIDTPDVLRVLSPIWLTKPETARRVRQRISVVMDWAKAAGHRTGDNPVSGITKGLPRQVDRATHHAALSYTDVPAFIARLRASDASEAVKLAFEFMILTAGRTGEIIGATWPEVDLENAVWVVPEHRMKGGYEHRVPLTTAALKLLEDARKFDPQSTFVFAGRSAGQPLSNMAFLMTLRRMKLSITGHGFRSAFRDWSAECTTFPNEACELALAHRIKSDTEAAYRRGDMLEKRRELMESWAAYATTPANNVVQLRA